VRITFDGIGYKTDTFQKTEVSQHARIKVRGEEAGAIEVYYFGEKVQAGQGPFLEKERDLLVAVAQHLGRIAERQQAAERLELFRDLIDGSNDCN
jgi:GAF domain-containing protein